MPAKEHNFDRAFWAWAAARSVSDAAHAAALVSNTRAAEEWASLINSVRQLCSIVGLELKEASE